MIAQLKDLADDTTLRIAVNRGSLIKDSFDALAGLEISHMKRHLVVRFTGERGVDAGGLKREWFEVSRPRRQISSQELAQI